MTVRTVACWCPSLPYSGPQTQVRTLAPLLLARGVDVRLQCLAPAFLAALHDLRRTTADVLHLVGLSVLRRHFLSGRWRQSPLVVSLQGHERLTRIDQWCLARVDRLVVPYPAAVGHFTSQGLAASKIVVIPPGVAAPIAYSVQEFRQSSGISGEGYVLFAAGSFHRRQEMIDAIWAYEIMRYSTERYHLLIAGDGPEASRARAFAQNLAPEGTGVQFLDARADVPALVQAADIVLVPSCTGGLTFTLEALAAGRPVVAYHTAALASVVQHEQNGLLVEPRSKPAMTKAIMRLVQDAALRERLGAAARATAAQYTLERAATAWHTVYTLTEKGS